MTRCEQSKSIMVWNGILKIEQQKTKKDQRRTLKPGVILMALSQGDNEGSKNSGYESIKE